MPTKKHHLLFGAHMSISGGLQNALIAGESIGCTAIQIFTKSNRQWYAKPISDETAHLFKETAQKSSIYSIIAHATYLINIASSDKRIEKASLECLASELLRCDQLGIKYLVLHPGAYTSGNKKDGLERIIQNLDSLLSATKTKTIICLETMAGQGSVLCAHFEDIAQILQQSTHKARLGVCFDTCHAFVAGYDLRTQQTYEKTWHDFDTIIGLEKLHAIHINDSKKELGSRIDRHEHIGQGQLGLKAFELLFNDARFFDIPKILETPKATKEPFTEDKKNMATIYSLLSSQTKKILGIEEKID